jgi:DNA polymerase
MSDPRHELAELAASLRWAVEREMDRGRTHVVMPAGVPEGGGVAAPSAPAGPTPRTAAKAPVKPRAAGTSTPAAPSAGGKRGNKLDKVPIEPESDDYADRMSALAALGQEASGCEKCGLCDHRTRVVFGTGAARTRVLFIGEAPGADEDRQGEPFVGRAGKLLDQIIEAVGFEREQIYIANILKCRPPKNRDPEPDEIEACTPYLEKQIELLQPRIICALGRFAGQFLTGRPKATMGALRGTLAEYKGIPVLPIYHPAALLRNPGWKRQVWEDVQVLREEYRKAAEL